MNYEEIFQTRYQNLNTEQKLAVDSIDGPVLVIAGPGSGKTELLGMRVANILRETDASPSEILCLTFTDAGVATMRKRLVTLIGETAHQVNIQTFHSLGTEIINNYPEFFFQGAIYNSIDELTQTQIIDEILGNLSLDNPLATKHPDQGYIYLKNIKTYENIY